MGENGTEFVGFEGGKSYDISTMAFRLGGAALLPGDLFPGGAIPEFEFVTGRADNAFTVIEEIEFHHVDGAFHAEFHSNPVARAGGFFRSPAVGRVQRIPSMTVAGLGDGGIFSGE